MPRPPEMTISASVSSGRPVETSSRRSTSFILAAGIFTLGFSTCAPLPAALSAGLETVGRRGGVPPGFPPALFPGGLPRATGGPPPSPALWVTEPASALAPASRPASPSTSAITFLGEPFRSSSTMHQYAVAMSDRLRVLAQRADELFHRVLDLALDDPPRRPRRQRLEVLHGDLRGGGREAEVAGLHVLDLLLLGAHDPLQRRIARLVEPLLRGEHGW